MLLVDGTSNVKGGSIGILLKGPCNILIKQALKFEFITSMNHAKYEAIIANMVLSQEMGASRLTAKSDSQLVANQVTDEYQEKEP